MEDEGVCKFCKEFSDQWIPVSKAIIGVNYPPLVNCKSEYCRCFVTFETKEIK